jgi:hypothetical protein
MLTGSSSSSKQSCRWTMIQLANKLGNGQFKVEEPKKSHISNIEGVNLVKFIFNIFLTSTIRNK